MSNSARFTTSEYEHMISCGAFAGPSEKRIELIRGELRMMSPQGSEHGELVSHLDDWSHAVLDRQKIKIRVQSSIEIPNIDTQPEPDIVWAKAQSYAQRRPQPEEIVLLIEVADSSLVYDLGEKCELYAEAGIRDYWVFDIPARQVHIFRAPSDAGYKSHDALSANDRLRPKLVDDISILVDEAFSCLDQ